MFRETSIIENLRAKPVKFLIVGTGGVGFNVGKFLIDENYPAHLLFFIDGDKTDLDTMYKYGYYPRIRNEMYKVHVLFDMLNRREKNRGSIMTASIAKRCIPDFYYKGMLGNNTLFRFIHNYDNNGQLVVLDCIDNSSYSKELYDELNEMGKKTAYFSAGFDGEFISMHHMKKTTGDSAGYQVGSSAYLSQLTALITISYISRVISINNNSVFPGVDIDLKKSNDVIDHYALFSQVKSLPEKILIEDKIFLDFLKQKIEKESGLLCLKNFYEELETDLSYANYVNNHAFTFPDKNSDNTIKENREIARLQKKCKKINKTIPRIKFSYDDANVDIPLFYDGSYANMLPPTKEWIYLAKKNPSIKYWLALNYLDWCSSNTLMHFSMDRVFQKSGMKYYFSENSLDKVKKLFKYWITFYFLYKVGLIKKSDMKNINALYIDSDSIKKELSSFSKYRLKKTPENRKYLSITPEICLFRQYVTEKVMEEQGKSNYCKVIYPAVMYTFYDMFEIRENRTRISFYNDSSNSSPKIIVFGDYPYYYNVIKGFASHGKNTLSNTMTSTSLGYFPCLMTLVSQLMYKKMRKEQSAAKE